MDLLFAFVCACVRSHTSELKNKTNIKHITE